MTMTLGEHTFRAVVQDGLGRAVTSGTKSFQVTARQPRKPLAGAAAGNLADFNTLNADVGPMQVRRSFLSPSSGSPWSVVPNSVNSTTMMADMLAGRISMWSFKPDPVAFALGNFDTSFKALLKSIKHTAYIALWHEPGSEFRSGLFTPAQWHAANNRMGQLIRANGNPNIKSYLVIEGRWAFTGGNGFAQYEYWHSDFSQNIDYIGFDQYTYPDAGPRNVHELLTYKATNMTHAPMTWAANRGLPVVIPEWGVSDAWGAIDKAKRMRDFWTWCKDTGLHVVCYFHNNHDLAREPQFSWECTGDSRAVLKAINDEAKAT